MTGHRRCVAVIEAFKYLADSDAAAAEAMIVGRLDGKTYPQVQRLAEEAALTVDPELAQPVMEPGADLASPARRLPRRRGHADFARGDLPGPEAWSAFTASLR